MGVETQFEWIDMPENIRHQYQNFTQAEMKRFREKTGYEKPFQSLEASVNDYYLNYLKGDLQYL